MPNVTVATLRAVVGLDPSDFRKGAEDVKKEARDLSGEIQTVATTLIGLGVALTAAVSVPVVKVGSDALHAAVQMDSLERALTATTHSAAETQRQFRELDEVAKLPGLGFKEAVEGSVRLQAAGQSAGMAKDELLAFGNAIAQVGKGKAELQIVGDELTRLASQSRVSGRSIMELSRQVPQLREIMKKTFGTADSMELEKLGVDSQKFLRLVTAELLKIPKVTDGAANSFENLDDSVFKLNASLGKSLLPTVIPVIRAVADAAEYMAQIWKEIPYPVQLTMVALAALLALTGPALIIFGALSASLLKLGEFFTALSAIEAANTAATTANATAQGEEAVALTASQKGVAGLAALFSIQTAEAKAFTGATIQNAVALNSLSNVLKVAALGVVSFLAGFAIGTAINDKFIGEIERAAQAVEDETKAHLKSIPYLEKAYEARKRLEGLEATIARTGNTALRDSALFKEVQESADFLTKQYKEAAAEIHKDFNSAGEAAMAELRSYLEKENKEIETQISKAKEKIEELKATTTLGKVQAEFPDISPELAKQLSLLKDQEEQVKRVADAQKKAREDAKKAVEEFAKQIAETTKQIAVLNAPNTLARTRAEAPVGTTETTIRTLAALRTQEEAAQKLHDAREAEKQKVEELNKKLGELNGTAVKAAGALTTVSTALTTAATTAAASPTFMGPPANLAGPIPKGPSASGVPGPVWTGAALPSASVQEFTKTVTVATGAVNQLATAQAAVNAAAKTDALIKLVQSNIDLKIQVDAATDTTIKHKTAVEFLHTAYGKLTASQKVLIDQNVALQQALTKAEEVRKVGEAWNDQRIALLAATSSTTTQKTALELLKKSFDSLSPALQAQITDIAKWKKETDDATTATARLKQFNDNLTNSQAESRLKFLQASAATDTQRVMLGFFADRIKELPASIKTAQEALYYLGHELGLNTNDAATAAAAILQFSDATTEAGRDTKFKDSVVEARKELLNAFAATDQERIALGFFSDKLKELPPDITTVAAALKWLRDVLHLNVDGATQAAAEIDKLNKRGKELSNIKSFGAGALVSGLEDLNAHTKLIEEAEKRFATFQQDMSQRLAVANRKLAPERSAVDVAWLEFLEHNDKLAKDLSESVPKAAAAYEEFKKVFQLEQEAENVDKLRKKLVEVNKELTDQTVTSKAYGKVLADLGIQQNQVTGDMDSYVKQIVKVQAQIKKAEALKKDIQEVADGVSGVFKDALGELFQHGFKNFFDSVVQGFRTMLQNMVAEWVASQIQKLLLNALTQLAGGMGGGSAGGSGFLGDAGGLDSNAFSTMAAKGADVSAGQRVMVGESGPEMFVPTTAGRIVPNGGGNVTQVYAPTYNIQTPDANSFRKSQTQILDDGRRAMNRSGRRNGS